MLFTGFIDRHNLEFHLKSLSKLGSPGDPCPVMDESMCSYDILLRSGPGTSTSAVFTRQALKRHLWARVGQNYNPKGWPLGDVFLSAKAAPPKAFTASQSIAAILVPNVQTHEHARGLT